MIRRKFVLIPAVAAFIALGGGIVSSLQIEAAVALGNRYFAWDRPQTADDFATPSRVFGHVTVVEPLNEQFTLEIDARMDPVLRRLVQTRFRYASPVFEVAVGPLFGAFNPSSPMLRSGISTEIRLNLLSLFYVSLRSDNTIAGRLIEEGDYIQERSDIAFGLFLPNMSPEFRISNRSFVQVVSGIEVVDRVSEYVLDTELFKKYVPYRMNVRMGYVDQRKLYTTEPRIQHRLGGIIIGVGGVVDVATGIGVLFDVTSHVYTFGLDTLAGISVADRFVYGAMIGVSVAR